MTPQEAHSYALQYFYYAESLPAGVAKNEAHSAAQAWSHEAHRLYQLTLAPSQGVPVPPQKKSSALVIVFAVVLPIVLVLALVGGVLGLWGLANITGDRNGSSSSAGLGNEPTGLPDEIPDSEPGTVEGDWRAATSTSTVPSDINMGAPSRFSTEFSDAEEFINRGSISGISVVYTNDSTYNCGWRVEYNFAGCYNPKYKETIFLWWDDKTTESDREFLAAHELSHYIQWHYQFDLLYSALDDEDIDYATWTKVVETDATCRVLSWGGYDETVAKNSSSPCDTNEWTPSWLEDEATELGIIVEDW